MRLVVLAVVLGLAAGCTRTDNEAVQQELQRLQGTWVGLSYTDAQRTVDGRDMAMSLVIDGDRFSVRFNDEVKAQGKLNIDPTRTPRTIDFLEDTQTGRGIYELYENSLRVCYDGTGQERPTKLEVKPGSAIRLFVLHRQTSNST
jgi:uncharacterized protein (TIGR03067 family)